MSIIICCYILIQTKVCHSDERKEKILTFHVLDKASKIKKSSYVLLVFDVYLTNTIAIKRKKSGFRFDSLMLYCIILQMQLRLVVLSLLTSVLHWWNMVRLCVAKNWDLKNLSIFVKMLRINLKLKKSSPLFVVDFTERNLKSLKKFRDR